MSELRFFDYDADALINEAVEIFDETLGESTGDADERRLVLMALMQVLISVGAKINVAGLNNLLRTATGEYLDAIGETALTPRIQAQPASVTMRFTLSVPRDVNTIIPAGVRVTPDGQLFFATAEALVIPAQTLNGDVIATCVVEGIEGNGYVSGSISTLVDPLPYIDTVGNIDMSIGGSAVESDDNYRERIRGASASYSTAGSKLSYEYWARSAHADIIDVEVNTPAPGEVELVVLTKDGTPSQQILDAVEEVCSGAEHRPLTDQVTVIAPELIPYDVTLTYYAPDNTLSVVREAVERPGGALDQYYAWQSAQLGRAINPNQLLVLLTGAGAVRVDLTLPAYTPITSRQVAHLRTATISSEALEV